MTDLTQNRYAGRTAARVVKSMIIGQGLTHALAFAQSQNWTDIGPITDYLKRGIVTGLTTVDMPSTVAADDFSAAVRPLTVIGRLQGVRRVPLRVRVLSALNGGSARFVGEGKPVPVSAADLTGETLEPKKCSGIVITTKELAESSKPSSENLLRDDLAGACAQGIDVAFLDPLNTGDAETPASVTSGVVALVSTGSALDNVDADLQRLLLQVSGAGSNMQYAVWIMRPATAAYLSGLRGTGGALAYPQISVLGGFLLGLPVLIAGNLPVPGSPASAEIVLLDAAEVCIADENQAEFETAESAAFQLSDAPTNNAADGTATNMVSMYQTYSIAVRGTRWLNWTLRRQFVSVLTGVTY
jgi:HK97 family phage major capsid protein